MTAFPYFSKKEKERESALYFLKREEEEKLARRKAKVFGLPYINLIVTPISIDALSLVDEKRSRQGEFVPFYLLEKNLKIACLNPQNPVLKETISLLKKKGYKIQLFLCSKTSLLRAWKEYEKVPKDVGKVIGKIIIKKEEVEEIESLDDFKEKIEIFKNKGVNYFLKMILIGALFFDASDIHIVPRSNDVRVRFRLDGIMHTIFFFEKHLWSPLLARIKVLAHLKVNVSDVAQDGRFTILYEGKEIEVRVSVVPGEYGEDVVMRILNPKMILTIDQLGLHPWLKEILLYEMSKPTGMILTTGPTGSGKTTTLYACLRYIARPQIKVFTIEDPIEYHLEGIAQTQVEPEKGYDFANALRAALRQDPDVILVGEIRDQDTANTAVQAALTGHLVFSTLHTNDAAGTIPRLIEMGVTPSNIGPALNLAIAQRLLRRLCEHCKVEDHPSSAIIEKIKEKINSLPEKVKSQLSFDLNNLKFFRAKGCKFCHNTGYKGRIGIFEMFQIKGEIEKIIPNAPSVEEVREAALKEGMIPFQVDGLLRVLEGITSLEELERITGPLE